MLKVENVKEISRSVNHKFCMEDVCRAKFIFWIFCQLSIRLIYRLKFREVFSDEIHDDSFIFGLYCSNGCIFKYMNGTWLIFALVVSVDYHVSESDHIIYEGDM